MKIKIPLLPGFLFLLSASTLANAENKQTIEAETAEMSGGALKIADSLASKGYLASLNKSGQALRFSNLQASSKLAIRYASMNVGTISVTINNQRPIKVNIHSSGAFTGSFLYSIIDVTIPTGARLTVSLDTSDVALNIDRIEYEKGKYKVIPFVWNEQQQTLIIDKQQGTYPGALKKQVFNIVWVNGYAGFGINITAKTMTVNYSGEKVSVTKR